MLIAWSDLDFLRNASNALHSADHIGNLVLFCEGRNVPGQCNHAVLGGDTDMSCIDARFEGKLVNDALPQHSIVHDCDPLFSKQAGSPLLPAIKHGLVAAFRH